MEYCGGGAPGAALLLPASDASAGSMRDVLNAREAPLSEQQIVYVCRECLQVRAPGKSA